MPLENTNIYRVARELRAERNELREVVRRQGEFIQSIKQQIRDFRDHPPLR